MVVCAGGLVDLLLARSGVTRANLDGGAAILDGEVLCLGAVLHNAYLVLSVAGVGYTLDACALVGVVATV